jgi:DNA-binding transcriptional MerR regulator
MAVYRVEELAAAAGVSVEALRSYQSKGLLPAPRHEGRIAYYDDRHLSRLREILELKHQGYSLRVIGQRYGPGSPGPGSGGGAAAVVAAAAPSGREDPPLTLRDVAARVNLHVGMLRSFVASGVLVPLAGGEEEHYSAADVRAVRMLLALISGGVPIEEFMEVAHPQIETADAVARGAIDLFLHYVRDPMIEAGLDEDEEAERLVAALAAMLQATTALISYNFQRRVLNGVTEELVRRGASKELEVLRREVLRRRVEVFPE